MTRRNAEASSVEQLLNWRDDTAYQECRAKLVSVREDIAAIEAKLKPPAKVKSTRLKKLLAEQKTLEDKIAKDRSTLFGVVRFLTESVHDSSNKALMRKLKSKREVRIPELKNAIALNTQQLEAVIDQVKSERAHRDELEKVSPAARALLTGEELEAAEPPSALQARLVALKEVEGIHDQRTKAAAQAAQRAARERVVPLHKRLVERRLEALVKLLDAEADELRFQQTLKAAQCGTGGIKQLSLLDLGYGKSRFPKYEARAKELEAYLQT